MKQDYPALYRIWHWLTAISTLGLLGTVLLRKTFLSWRTNSALIQSKMADIGTEVSADNAKAIAKAIRAPMWEWHYIFGLVLAIAIVLRVVVLVRGLKKPAILRAIKESDNHERLKAVVYTGIMLILVFMTISGGLMYFREAFGISKDLSKSIKEIHEPAMWGVLGLSVIHIIGVFAHEFRTKESIISKMTHGDDDAS